MTIRVLTSAEDLVAYGNWLRDHPQATLWQSLEWKRFQEAARRTVRIYAAHDGGRIVSSALVVIDRTVGGYSTWEIPRGPLVAGGEWREAGDTLLSRIIGDAKNDGCISVFLSPLQLAARHPQLATCSRHIHPEATRIVNLTLSDDDLLAQMKPKGRYNIGLAQKRGVRVELGEDTDAFAALAAETAGRDRFTGHSARHYGAFLWNLPGSFLLLAYAPKTPSGEAMEASGPDDSQRPIAGLMGVIWGTTGIYYYGASGNRQRELMAPYLLQWEAMRLCRSRGCVSYDLFGVAPEGATDHPWQGVSDFKAKFGGTVITYPPEQEITLKPMAKKMLGWKRKLWK